MCNPFGGLGLTGGIVDVGGLFDCLVGIHQGKADDSILDQYTEIRRHKYSEIINPISSSNIKLMFDTNHDTALETVEFLKLAKRTESHPAFALEMMTAITAIRQDFTRYYRTGAKDGRSTQPVSAVKEEVNTKKAPIVVGGVTD